MKKQMITILIISLITIQMANAANVSIIDYATFMSLDKRSRSANRFGDPIFKQLEDTFSNTIDLRLPCSNMQDMHEKWHVTVEGGYIEYDQIVRFDLTEIPDEERELIYGHCRVVIKTTSSVFKVEAKNFMNRWATVYGFKARSSPNGLR